MSKRSRLSDNDGPVQKVRPLTRGLQKSIESGGVENDGLLCSSCNDSIPNTSDHVDLDPCGCKLCCRCALAWHGSRSDAIYTCPVPNCRFNVTSHRFYSRRNPDAVKVLYKEKTVVDDDTLKRARPMVYLHKQKEHLFNIEDNFQAVILYATVVTKEKGQGKKLDISNCVKVLSHIGDEPRDEDYCDGLQEFAAFLHPTIVTPSVTPYHLIPTLSPTEFNQHAIDSVTPLSSFLFGLATAKPRFDHNKIISPGNQSHQSQFLAIAVAHDMIIRSNVTYPCHLQLMLNERLANQKLSTQVRDLLSALRIVPSRSYTNKSQYRAVVEAMMSSTGVGTHDFVYINFDNMEMRAKADSIAKTGIRHFTPIQIIHVKRSFLEKIRVYSDNPKNSLSRRTKDWKSMCAKDKTEVGGGSLARKIVQVRTDDKRLLSESIMEGIVISTDDVMNDRIRVGQWLVRTGRVISRDSHAFALRNTPLSEMSDTGVEAVLTTEDFSVGGINITGHRVPRMGVVEDWDDEPQKADQPQDVAPLSRYGDSVSLSIIKENLATNATVKMIADFAWELRDKQLKEWRESAEYDEKVDQPIAADIVTITGDGKPIEQARRIICEDMHKDSPKYNGKLYACNGGFHTLLKLFNAIGDLFENLFPALMDNYRTLDQIGWVRKPRDPRQAEAEYPIILYVIYASAAKYLSEKLGRAPSAVEVNDHMIKRAEQYPCCMVVLLWTRFAELTKLMRMSERLGVQGCIHTYHACLRLALPLFAMTHKTDYVRLIVDWFETWECASDAFQAIYKSYLYTRLTSTGFPIWLDLFMEMTIKDFREHCGKVYRRGLEAKLEHLCYKIPKQKNEGNFMKSLRYTKDEKKTQTKTHIFIDSDAHPAIKVMERIHLEQQLFHHTNPPIVGRDRDGQPIYAEEGSFRIPQGKTTTSESYSSPEVVNFYKPGSERGVAYAQKNNIDEQYKVSRSEDAVKLTKVLATNVDVKADLDAAVIRATSLEPTALEKSFKKMDHVIDAIQATITTLNVDYEVKPQIKAIKTSNMRKGDLCKELVKLRKRLFKIDTEAQARTVKEIQDEYKQKYSSMSREQRREILQSGLYSLDPDVLAMPRYCDYKVASEGITQPEEDNA